MKKSLLILSIILISFTSLSQIRIVKVVQSTNTITVKNFGTSEVNISGYRLCSLIKYTSNLTTGITINSGDMNLGAGEEVEFVAPGGASSSWQDLKANSDLGLYLPSGSFGSANNMVDFVQWGSAGNGREGVANTKGIWTSGDFIEEDEPYTYIGDGTQNGVDFWMGVSTNNDPTDISLSASTIQENNSIDDVIGALSSTDSDESDTHTYSLIEGTGSDDNSSFDISGSNLIAKEVFDFESKSTYSILVQTDDGNRGTFSKSFSISITDVAEAPTDITLNNQAIVENNEIGDVIGTFSTIDEDSGETYTYDFATGTGDTDNASFQIAGSELQANAMFDADTKDSYSIRVITDDGNENTFEKTFTISITNVNEMPTDISLSGNTIAENESAGIVVGLLTTTDPDMSDTHTYNLVSGSGDTDNDSFSINGDELLSAESFNFEMKDTYSIRIESRDNNESTFSKIFTISVIDVSEPPTDIALSNMTIAENNAVGDAIGGFTTIDDDNGEIYTYDFVSGTGDTDNGSFLIMGDELQANEVFDADLKATYTIRIVTDDGNENTLEKSFSITITGENETPTDISLSNSSIVENEPIGIVVGTFTSADPDMGDTHTYCLVDGSGDLDNQSFSVNGNELQTSEVFNFEMKNSYSVRIESRDNIGATFSKSFTISITDVIEAPTDITLSNQTIAENNEAGDAIGTFSTIDDDNEESYTYDFVSGTGDTDNSSFQIMGDELQASESFDADTKDTYSIRVVTDDGNDNTFEKSFTITIMNVNETPTNLSVSNTSLAENEGMGFVIGTFTTDDQDTDDTHTYTLIAGMGDSDNASFSIDGGELKTAEVFNFEVKNAYSIRIETKDNSGSTFSKQFNITVSDENEAPTDISLSSNVVCFGDESGFEIGLFSSMDEDENETFTYSLVSGEGDDNNSFFTIADEKLVFNTTATNDIDPTLNIRVQTKDVGNLTFEKEFEIMVSGDPVLGLTNSSISVYPNPFSRELSITINEYSGEANILLTDLSGKEWMNQKAMVVNGSLSLTKIDIPSGFYILRVSAENAIIFNERIVKR